MKQVEWTLLHPKVTPEHLGFLPGYLHEDDPATAAEQLNEGYSFAGGWRPQEGFTLTDKNALLYPGDPPLKPIAEAKLRDETVYLYDYAIVAVVQKDRSFETCRMD